MGITKRGGKYGLVLHRPVRYASIDSRKQVWLSLHTDSKSTAEQKAPIIRQHQIDEWEAKLRGDTTEAQAQFDAAKELAALRGFRYLPAAKVATLPRDELLDRIFETKDKRDAKALLGALEQPPITMSQALELFWTLTKDQTFGKSADQSRRWKN